MFWLAGQLFGVVIVLVAVYVGILLLMEFLGWLMYPGKKRKAR